MPLVTRGLLGAAGRLLTRGLGAATGPGTRRFPTKLLAAPAPRAGKVDAGKTTTKAK